MTTIKRGTRFTIPAWKARRRRERTRYAIVTQVRGDLVYYRFDGQGASEVSHARPKALLEKYAEVTP